MTAQNHIEAIISIGHGKAYANKFPHRIDNTIKRDETSLVRYHLDRLDDLGIDWNKQNTALMFINNCNDEKVWDCFYRNSFKYLALQIFNGKEFNHLI